MKKVRFTPWHYLVLFILLNANNALGQANLLERKLSVDINSRTLQEALATIQDSAQVTFSYSSRKIPVDHKVSLHLFNRTFERRFGPLI